MVEGYIKFGPTEGGEEFNSQIQTAFVSEDFDEGDDGVLIGGITGLIHFC